MANVGVKPFDINNIMIDVVEEYVTGRLTCVGYLPISGNAEFESCKSSVTRNCRRAP